jgi:copper transport protein
MGRKGGQVVGAAATRRGTIAAVTSPVRIARSALAALLLGLVLGLAGPAMPAQAHATFVGSDPAEGAILPTAPERVVLSFSEPVRLIPDRIQVVGPGGDPVDAGEPSLDGSDVVVPLGGAADTGTYLVSFRVVSLDSHPVAGSVTYSVGAPSPVPSPAGVGEVDDPVVDAAMSVVKYVGYAGLALLVGPALMLAMLWPRRLSRRGVGRLLWAGVGLVAVSTLAGIWVQAPYRSGLGLFEVTAGDLRGVLSSQYGAAHLVRLGVLAAVALLLRPLLAARAGRADLLLLAGLGVVGLGTWPVAGHPVASPVPYVSIALSTVHLAAAAAWVGGLVVLAGFLLRLADERELGAILPEWSRWAALSVSLLLLAGLLMAVVEVGAPGALVSTWYGRLLLVKVGLVVVVLVVAGYSRRLIRRRLAASRPRVLRSAVAAEAGVLAAVLVVAAVLAQTTPARTEAEAAAEEATTGFFTTLETDLYTLQVVVDPAARGGNTMHLTAYGPDGEPLRVEEWRATTALPSAGVEPVEVALRELTDNHARGEVALPVAGDWELRFTIRVSDIDQASVGVAVPIR